LSSLSFLAFCLPVAALVYRLQCLCTLCLLLVPLEHCLHTPLLGGCLQTEETCILPCTNVCLLPACVCLPSFVVLGIGNMPCVEHAFTCMPA
jgi:hypothetical protein